MAKTPGPNNAKRTKDDKGARNRRTALLGGGAAEIGSGSADPRGKPKVDGTWRYGENNGRASAMSPYANGDGHLQGKAGVGPSKKGGTGARRGRPPGVKNGQGRGKK